MKTTNLIVLALCFSLVFGACRKEPVHITDTVGAVYPPIIDIKGIYFGEYMTYYYGYGGPPSSYVTNNCYLKITGDSFSHFMNVYSDSLCTHNIWTGGFYSADNPIIDCSYYIHFNSGANANNIYGPSTSLTIRSCDSIFFNTSSYQGYHSTAGKSFTGVKLP